MNDLNLFKRHFMWLSKNPVIGIVLFTISIMYIAICFGIFIVNGSKDFESLTNNKAMIVVLVLFFYAVTYFTVRTLYITVNTNSHNWCGSSKRHLLLILEDNTPIFVKDVFWGKGKYVYVSGLDRREIRIDRYFSYIRGEMKCVIKVSFDVYLKNDSELDPKILYQTLLDIHSCLNYGEETPFLEILTKTVIQETEKQESLLGKYLDEYLSKEITREGLTDKVWRNIVFPKSKFSNIDRVVVYYNGLSVSREI